MINNQKFANFKIYDYVMEELFATTSYLISYAYY